MFVWRRLEFAFLCAGFGRRTFYFINFQEDVMKKIICAFLILILCISFCACDGNKDIEQETVTTAATTTESSESTTETTSEMKKDYVLNTNSMKFHYPSCHAAEKISDKNKKEYHGTRDAVVEQGYTACGICNP